MDMIKSMKEIATKINPNSMFYKEGIQQIHKPFVLKNRHAKEVRFLEYNIQMIPKIVLSFSDHYPSAGQD